MRILVTGMTAKQRGGGSLPLFLLLDAATLALRSLGHTVTRNKTLTVGESLRSEYDAAIVALAPFGATSAGSQRIAQLTACLDLPHVVAQDDWRVGGVFGVFKTPEGAINQFWRGGLCETSDAWRADRDAAMKRKPAYDHMLTAWSDTIPACLTCAFNWGKHDILKAYHRFGSKLCWDPTPWIVDHFARSAAPEVLQTRKKRQWVLASLSEQDAWVESLGLKWPVVGPFKHVGERGRSWQMPEADVFKLYEESWGVLSPPYPELNGSGWWRNRFPLSTLAGSVIACDPSEISALKASWFYTDPHQVESLSDEQLAALAARQYNEMWNYWSMPQSASAKQLADWLDANWQEPFDA